MISQSISHYRVIRELGAGGMGVVYLGEDPRLGRPVAIKVLPPHLTGDPERVRRFEQEARAASALNHPNIVTIYDIGECDDGRFIVAELIDGETLRAVMQRGLPIAEALRIAIQTTEALAAAHAVGVIHRDVKPENIMIRRDGWVKVVDFGLAKLTERPSGDVDKAAATHAHLDTEPGTVMGTVSYMSPEQARGLAVDASTDVFSMGVVVYEMVTGRRPFRGSTAADVIASILHDEPAPLSGVTRVPTELERIVAKALSKDRRGRYDNAAQLADDLRRAAGPARGETGSPDAATTIVLGTSGSSPSAEGPTLSRRTIAVSSLLVLGAIGTGVFTLFRRERKRIDTLAVLPFVNGSRDADAEYLSDGITENLINSLSQIPELKVRPRSSVWRYKGARVADPQKIARELNVRAVLLGSVTRHNDRLAISTELIDADENSQIWGTRYDRRAQEILGVQEEIASSIVANLRVRLEGNEKRLLGKRHTDNTEAYERYLRGRYYLNRRTAEAIRQGREFFEQAIDIDPTYALAYSGVSDAYALLAGQAALAPRQAYPAALSAAKKAIELDPALAEGHASLAHAAFHVDDLAAAEREFARALELKPGYFVAWQWKSEFLLGTRRPADALAAARQAVALEPLDLAANAQVAWVLIAHERYEDALAQARKTVEIDRNYFLAHVLLGMIYVHTGRFDEGVSEFREAERLTDGARGPGALALAYAQHGQETEARAVLNRMAVAARERYVNPMELAQAYAALHDAEATLLWLRRAREDEGRPLTRMATSPDLAFLRNDPRFAELVGIPRP